MRRLAIAPLGLLAAGLMAGCGGGPKLVPVSGMVKLDGKPFPNAMVSFQPIGKGGDDINPGKGSMAVTDENGRYVLLYEGTKKGVLTGKHIIRISTLSGHGTERPPDTGTPDGIILPKGAKPEMDFDPIPVEWNEKSDKTFDVPDGGTDQANFDIVTKKGKR
jgi:hypothetical protein